MENHASVTGWQKLFFSYKCFQLPAAIAIATFETYSWKLSGYLILICSFSLCSQNFSKVNCFRVYRTLIMWSSHAKSLLPGLDSIHLMILKKCARTLAPSLCAIVNVSFASGMLPHNWKLTDITPLHKKAAKNVRQNYFPVSLTSVVCKVSEMIETASCSVLNN